MLPLILTSTRSRRQRFRRSWTRMPPLPSSIRSWISCSITKASISSSLPSSIYRKSTVSWKIKAKILKMSLLLWFRKKMGRSVSCRKGSRFWRKSMRKGLRDWSRKFWILKDIFRKWLLSRTIRKILKKNITIHKKNYAKQKRDCLIFNNCIKILCLKRTKFCKNCQQKMRHWRLEMKNWRN